MSNFVRQALARTVSGAPPWLAAVNQRGQHYSAGRALPTIAVEDWQYTSLRALTTGGFVALPAAPAAAQQLTEHYQIDGLESYRLVFVDGQFSAARSAFDELPEGVTLVPFSSASESDVTQITACLGQLAAADSRLFTALNDSWLADGVYLRVSRQVSVERPIEVVWLTTPQAATTGLAQRLLVELEEGSQATVIEQFVSSDEQQNTFTNGVSEFVVGDNAHLHHCRLHLEEAGALHVGAVQVSLGRAATLNGFHMALGGVLKRVDLTVHMRGEGAHCELNGVYLPRNREVLDYHVCLEHEVPNCTSNQTFRGIVADQARAVFNGRIHIHRQAQNTSAHLNNRNLLTSNTAEVDTKPELEIYADDVQCSHGATVSQLDDSEMYYLRSRGISELEARVMLSFGFINEVLNRIEREPLRNYLRPKLVGLFSQDPNLTRHLL